MRRRFGCLGYGRFFDIVGRDVSLFFLFVEGDRGRIGISVDFKWGGYYGRG